MSDEPDQRHGKARGAAAGGSSRVSRSGGEAGTSQFVPIFEIGQHKGQHYFSMPYVDGESLAHKVASGSLPARKAAQLMRKVAEAVAYAHVEGVIHRDLKPANVLLDEDNEPRVTDFGLAKRIATQSLSSNGSEAAASLTATGQVFGTPSYMPPEQAAGKTSQVGPLSDV